MKANRITTIALTLLFSLSICFTSAISAVSQPTINVAVAQLNTADVGNFDKMVSLAKQAKFQGADLIIFPEESVFGWLNPDVFTKATPIPGKYSEQFVAIAKGVNIWVAAGIAEQGPKAGPGSQKDAYQAYDSSILINPQGQIVLHHLILTHVKEF